MDTAVQLSQISENTYHAIRQSLVAAQRKLNSAVNSAMVTAYWEIIEPLTEKSFCIICLTGSPANLEEVLTNPIYVKCVNSIAVFQFETHCVLN